MAELIPVGTTMMSTPLLMLVLGLVAILAFPLFLWVVVVVALYLRLIVLGFLMLLAWGIRAIADFITGN